MGYTLSPLGEDIVRKGGHDDQSPDDMLVLELMKRAPGLTPQEYQDVFVAMLHEYGEDALFALRNGYVKIEEARGGTRPEARNDAG